MEKENKQNLIEELVEVFKKETLKFSNEIEGILNYKIDVYYKKNNPEKGYHSIDASLMLKDYVVKFEYKINVNMLVPKSTLEIRFMFENGKLPVEYSIYDLLQIINPEDFKCYTIFYITNKTQMKEALKYLYHTFNKYKKEIEKLSSDEEKLRNIEDNIKKNIYITLKENVFESRDVNYLMRMLELYYIIDLSRFTTDTYILYLKGNYNKALRKYRKIEKKTTTYEKRLMKYLEKIIESGKTEEILPNNLNTLLRAKKLKSAKTELLPMYLSWIFITPIWCVIYALIFLVLRYVISLKSIYTGGVDIFYVFLPSFITAIVNSYFTRKTTYKIFFRRNSKKLKEIDDLDRVESVGSINNKMTKFFQFIIAGSIIFIILISNSTISFYDDIFIDNLDFLKFKGTTYEYYDIKSMYEAEGFINSLGDVVKNKTYVIILKDDTKINLYEFFEYEDIKENIIPILESKKVEIKHIDLVDNINDELNT